MKKFIRGPWIPLIGLVVVYIVLMTMVLVSCGANETSDTKPNITIVKVTDQFGDRQVTCAVLHTRLHRDYAGISCDWGSTS